MKTNPIKEGTLTENSNGIGTVTRKMVRERAVETAAINGRSARDVSKSDWDRAKLELTGSSDADSKQAILEAAPESERWIQCLARPGGKRRRLQVTTKMKKGEAIMKNWWMKASPKRNLMKAARLPTRRKKNKPNLSCRNH